MCQHAPRVTSFLIILLVWSLNAAATTHTAIKEDVFKSKNVLLDVTLLITPLCFQPEFMLRPVPSRDTVRHRLNVLGFVVFYTDFIFLTYLCLVSLSKQKMDEGEEPSGKKKNKGVAMETERTTSERFKFRFKSQS